MRAWQYRAMNLLMIPGPIEISPRVASAAAQVPPGHMAPAFVESFGRALKAMRKVWLAADDSQPFVSAGSGTTAMDMAVANLVEPGQKALVLWSGYFSDRLAEMVRRAGASVTLVYPGGAQVFDASLIGRTPSLADVEQAFSGQTLLFATHVDTSTGVRVDAKAFARFARAQNMLSVFDGVCATAGERFDMQAWGADVYLTASQKAIGAPPGLALLIASRRALDARKAKASPPPLSLDWEQWMPIMQGYEAGTPKYFATPATSLVLALEASLAELLDLGMDGVFAAQAAAASRMGEAWSALGLRSLVQEERDVAGTLSALLCPDGVDAGFVKRVAANGVTIAGGLIAPLAAKYFRVGHMCHSARTPEHLTRTIDAITRALRD